MTALLLVLGLGYIQSEIMPDLPNDLAHDWYGLGTWWPLLGVIAFGIWAWRDKRAIVARIQALEGDVADLKEKLTATEKLYTVALRHIREWRGWFHGGRHLPPPEVPKELHEHL